MLIPAGTQRPQLCSSQSANTCESHALLVLAAAVNWTSRSYIRTAALSTSVIRLDTVNMCLLLHPHERVQKRTRLGQGARPGASTARVGRSQRSRGTRCRAPIRHNCARCRGLLWDPRASEMPGPAGARHVHQVVHGVVAGHVLVLDTDSRATDTLPAATTRTGCQVVIMAIPVFSIFRTPQPLHFKAYRLHLFPPAA